MNLYEVLSDNLENHKNTWSSETHTQYFEHELKKSRK
jgi:hypothetical protein